MAKQVLFVIDFSDNEIIGGHIKSAMHIMDSFIQIGYRVHFLINNRTSPVLEKLNPGINIIQDSYKNKYRAYITRTRTIRSVIKQQQIDFVVAMDTLSAYFCSLACTLAKVPLVPIIPGGGKEALEYLPLKLKKTIVFSDENRDNLIEMWKFRSDQILVRNGRLSFDGRVISDYDLSKGFRIAYISGLRTAKLAPFRFFLDQIEKSVKLNLAPLQIDIVGDGQHRADFEAEVRSRKLENVRFAGYSEITFEFLQNYHLVVAQARGALEALSMGIPVAICGDNGYKGLINMENVSSMVRTNLTGRGLDTAGNLGTDVAFLLRHGMSYNIELNSYIVKMYDVKMLRDAIIEICETENLVPFNGSMIRTSAMNLKTIMIGVSHQFDKYVLKR
ncbi:MAG: glycosyltransferase [Mucilaginibacter polytrichastri]|nr:glycosyltransferase [Mucilaginibacter polytrichastri]